MTKSTARMNLVGEDGNAFSILGRARKALQRAGVSEEEIAEYSKEAKSGDYDNLLQVTMDWIVCDEENDDEEK